MDRAEFETAVSNIATPPDLWALCTTFFRSQGVVLVTYHHLPPPGAMDVSPRRIRSDGFPEDWVARYVAERLWRSDPIVLHARDSPEPFYWSEIVDLVDLTDAEQEFLEARRAAGIGDGLGIQVFGPNGRNGYCGLGLPQERSRLPREQVHTLHWACQMAHLRYCALLAPLLEATPHLSMRESEVLSWVARGKSNSIIADILGISNHTVDAHLRRVYLKLGVSDRISATVRGIGVGLIHTEY